METQIKKKRANRAKPKVKVEKLDLTDVVDMGSVSSPKPAARLAKTTKYNAMGFYKEGGLYYWAHVVVEGDKATLIERGPGDVKAHVLDDFKVQVVKRIMSKELEG